jgi:heme oxygenase
MRTDRHEITIAFHKFADYPKKSPLQVPYKVKKEALSLDHARLSVT